MKKYPDWTDFEQDQVIYGVSAPFVGIGVYTLDRKYSWPDRECTTKKEYEAWAWHLQNEGYEIPEKYKEAYVTKTTENVINDASK